MAFKYFGFGEKFIAYLLSSIFLPPANEVWGKVIFSVA